MGKSLFIAKQSSHPRGWFGHIVARVMARETASANRQAIEHLAVADGDAVLDIGSGHGRTLSVIAQQVPSATLAGVDPSDVMLSVARNKCRRLIAANRMQLETGTADALRFDDATFDKVVTVHTTYFWPALEPGLREARRVLREGGRFVIGFRPSDDPIAVDMLPASVYALHSIVEMTAALKRAGFSSVQIERNDVGRGFIVWAIATA